MAYLASTAFDGATLKVVRANRHIDELKVLMAEIERTKPYALAVSKKADQWALDFGDLGPQGAMIPLIIGDAIHNLRAACDHLWTALALAASLPEDRDKAGVKFASFPFHETRENCKNVVDKGPIKKAFPDTESLILDKIRPYSDCGGNHLFWTITKLDKIDKHNLLIPTIRVHRASLSFKTGNVSWQITDCTFSNAKGIVSSDNSIEFDQNPIISLEISFPKENILGGEPVIPTLLNMSEATGQVVKLFRETFVAV